MYTKIWLSASKVYCNLFFYLVKSNYKSRKQPNSIVQEYVLPDFTNNSTGHIRAKTDSKDNNNSDQILTMNNERFMIPEILMHPSDIGLDQAGIPEAITQSVLACDSCKIETCLP